MARAGSVKLPGLLIWRLWFNSRMSSCQVDGPGATPGSRTTSFQGCASARGRVSKPQLPPGSTEAACHFHFGVVADKQCTCPASKLMWERYPPTPPISLRETRPMHREKPHKLLQVGVTPTPATNFSGK